MERVHNTQKNIREILDKKMKDFNQLDIKFEKILLIISETDIRSLIFACFIESPIIFIENDFENQRLIMLIGLMSRIFPKMYESWLFFTPEEYLTFSQEQPLKIRHFTIYNLVYKLSVHKPFLDSQSEPFQENLKRLCLAGSSLDINHCRANFENLSKFAGTILDYPDTDAKKLADFMKKKYPEATDVFNTENIGLMRERLKFYHFLSFPNLDPVFGPIFIWNDIKEKSNIATVSNVIEKLCLNAIFDKHEISTRDLLEHLQKFVIAKMAKLTQNSLVDLLQKYIQKSWIIKK